MSIHPYRNKPNYNFWSRSVAGIDPGEVDPVVKGEFQISQSDKVATAGSCFAQHIARKLALNGFNYFVSEKAHPITSPDLISTYNYGTYSARYGNIYTSRQLLQLILRVFGEFTPKDDIWQDERGNLIDPFRPQIQPNGFITENEYKADRTQHFEKVRRMFTELDIFIFTLGMTECWVSKEDGAAYPVCPGVSGGTFDENKHKLVNLSIDEVNLDMLAFIDKLRLINPKAKVILTVSPVPLVATAEDRHVLVSNTYSKSVLRVAAEFISKSCSNVAYFPSYEIITGNFSRCSYFDKDLRSITETGVNHVMRLFLKYYAGVLTTISEQVVNSEINSDDSHVLTMTNLVKVNCEEVALDYKL